MLLYCNRYHRYLGMHFSLYKGSPTSVKGIICTIVLQFTEWLHDGLCLKKDIDTKKGVSILNYNIVGFRCTT